MNFVMSALAASEGIACPLFMAELTFAFCPAGTGDTETNAAAWNDVTNNVAPTILNTFIFAPLFNSTSQSSFARRQVPAYFR